MKIKKENKDSLIQQKKKKEREREFVINRSILPEILKKKKKKKLQEKEIILDRNVGMCHKVNIFILHLS